jgi:undecaprenyl-diphosphatase
MHILEPIILGIVQGLAEFIPVSSSAHLVILPWLFGWTDPVVSSLGFDVALHLGTLLAVLVFFASDWWRLIKAWFRSVFERKIGDDLDRRMAWFLVLGTIPGALAGALLEGKIDEAYHSAPISQTAMIIMAAALAVMGGLLWLADSLAKHARTIEKVGLKDAIVIGCAQAFAIIPGFSRSGSTMTAGLALGLERGAAAKFSFLLSAPIIAGAGLKNAIDLVGGIRAGSVGGAELAVFPIGFVAAAVSGFLCIKFLMKFLSKHSTKVFAWYRWALAALVLAVALVRG